MICHAMSRSVTIYDNLCEIMMVAVIEDYLFVYLSFAFTNC